MTIKVINGTIKNGKIIPEIVLPGTASMVGVKIIILPVHDQIKARSKYRGGFGRGWGDPVKYQKEIRKELER